MDDEKILREVAIEMIEEPGRNVESAPKGKTVPEQIGDAREAGRPFDSGFVHE